MATLLKTILEIQQFCVKTSLFNPVLCEIVITAMQSWGLSTSILHLFKNIQVFLYFRPLTISMHLKKIPIYVKQPVQR